MLKTPSPVITRFSTLLIMLLLTAAPLRAEMMDAAASLQEVLDGAHRTAEEKARDQYRHPVETLQFFGIRPDMTVVEIFPGGGWYTKVLAPFLKDRGTYYAAGYAPDPGNEYVARTNRRFEESFVAHPELYGNIHSTALDPSGDTGVAPDGSVDMVLTFRNVHNWMAGGYAARAFRTFYRALKPGGILGLVEHRAAADEPQEPRAKTGYVRQDHVIRLANEAGFELIGQAEINANPKDSRDHPKGVWTLPPTYRLGSQDRNKYAAIGESDRMTLKFRKPAQQ